MDLTIPLLLFLKRLYVQRKTFYLGIELLKLLLM